MRKKIFLLLGACCLYLFNYGQVAIANDNSMPDQAAMLDIKSTSKGILIPRMTSAQRTALAGILPTGLMVYDSTTNSFWFYNSGWKEIQNSATTGWMYTSGNQSVKSVGRVTITGDVNLNGNIIFQGPSASIVSSSLIGISGRTFFLDKAWFQDSTIFRGGIWSDGQLLTIHGGATFGYVYFPGKIGIGVSTPAGKLDILGGHFNEDIGIGNSNYRLRIRVDTTGINNFGTTIIQDGPDVGKNMLTLGAAGKLLLTIDGNTSTVGINNGNPKSPLSFQNNFGNKIALYQTLTTQSYGIGVQSGLLQIHTDASNTSIVFGYGSSSTFTTRMQLENATGNLRIAGSLFSNTVFSPSDITLKKDIVEIEDGLDKINQLNGYNYHWKSEESDPSLQSGVMAQEVQKVLPNLVHKDSNGTLMVNYSGIIPYLIQGMKEQQTEIKTLKKELEELKQMMRKKD